MKRTIAAAILASFVISAAGAAPGIVVTPTNESDPPNPASFRDGRGDVLAFHIDGIAPKAYRATVRCKNGKIGETQGRVHNWQSAVDLAFGACESL